MTINADGFLLTSCDTLFSTEFLVDKDVKEVFPFLQSVFHELLENLEIGRSINFEKVATKHPFLSGFYDYAFKLIRIKNNQWGIQWELIDATEAYTELKKEQQSRHDDML